jgi:hypothetical protein
MRLLFKLLKKNINVWQLAGFAIANLVGAVIVLFGIQAYKDAAQVMKSPDSVMRSNVLVLSKPVSTVATLAGALGAGPRTFSESEIEEIRNVEGVNSLATFRMSQFPVSGGISYGGFDISTEMFLESVPDEFLDVDLRGWHADVDDPTLPVIIPQTYINFYNYGFAASRGTPQISEAVFGMVPVNLVFYGREGRKVYNGRIVGLTDRMNSILVPDEFLRQANERYAVEPEKEPTRVIIESGSDGSDALMDFINTKKYVIDGGNKDAVRLLAVVRMIISIVVGLGLLISSLSFFLLLISILLLIEKNRYKNDTLHQLGYPDRTIALPYQVVAVGVDFVVWLLAAAVTILVYPVIVSLMQTISPGFDASGPGLIMLSALGLFALFSLIHIWLIRRKIRSR